MGWDYDDIEARVRREFDYDLTKEQLIERLIALEVAMYPFAMTLSCLNEESWRGTWASSDLFPASFHDTPAGAFAVWDSEKKKFVSKELSPAEWGDGAYEVEESVIIPDGRLLKDEFEIVGVHQQAPGAYCFCGQIAMRDVRQMSSVYYDQTYTYKTTPIAVWEDYRPKGRFEKLMKIVYMLFWR